MHVAWEHLKTLIVGLILLPVEPPSLTGKVLEAIACCLHGKLYRLPVISAEYRVRKLI